MGKLLGCGCTYLSSFPVFFWCGSVIRTKGAFAVCVNPFCNANRKQHLRGEWDHWCGEPDPAPVLPPPHRAWSQGAPLVGACPCFCSSLRGFSPAYLNIRFNWGLPAYQRQDGNFYEGKGLPRCWPDLSLLSLLHNVVLSHCRFSPIKSFAFSWCCVCIG